jgi:hypothetical protein
MKHEVPEAEGVGLLGKLAKSVLHWLYRPHDANFGYAWADMGRCYRCGGLVDGDGEYCRDHAHLSVVAASVPSLSQ